MKKIFFILFVLLGLNCLHAQIFIYQIVDKGNDPETGKILLKDNQFGCPPYTIQVKGRTTSFNETRNNLNPGLGIISFISLEADKYDIKVSNSNGCEVMLYAEIKNCAGFDITMDIPLSCNTNHVLVQANINTTLRIPSIKYEWINKNGSPPVSYWNNNVANLIAGNYIVKITDDNGLGCMSMKEFAVDNFSFNVSHSETKMCKERDDCLIKVTDSKGMTFPNRSFNYLWSDGINVNANSVFSREINVRSAYTVTVTDLLTLCTRTSSIPIGNRAEIPNFKAVNCKLFNLKHYYDANDKGTASFVFNSFLVAPIKCKLYSRATPNGQWIQGAVYTVNNVSEILIIKWMLPSYYKLCIFDGKSECEVGCLEFEILECDGEKNNVQLVTQSLSLPVTDQNFLWKVQASNTGGPCLYKFFKGSKHDNASLYLIKQEPIIGKAEADFLQLTNQNTTVGVYAMCPCGNKDLVINIDVCKPNWSLKSKPTITNICLGSIYELDNRYVEYQKNGEVTLEINVKENFNRGNPSLVGYDGYLNSIEWLDGEPVLSIFNSPMMTISRTFTHTGRYTLSFIDGNNCRRYHTIEIKNEFSYNKKPNSWCTYETYCGTTLKEYLGSSVFYYDKTNCRGDLYCDGEFKAPSYFGTKVKGEWIRKNMITGKYEYKSYCYFYDLVDVPNIVVSDPDILVPGFKFLGRGNKKSLVLRGPDILDGECCDEVDFPFEGGIDAIAGRLSRLDNPYLDSYTYGIDHNLEDSRCYAILDCGKGFMLIQGTETSISYCWENNTCMEKTNCSFQNVGTVDGNNVIINSSEYKFLADYRSASPSNCPPNTPSTQCFPSPGPGLQQLNLDPIEPMSSQIEKENKLKIHPNPFNESISLHYSSKLKEESLIISIFDLYGKCVYSEKVNLTGFEFNKEITTSNLSLGTYVLTINSKSTNLFQKIIKTE